MKPLLHHHLIVRAEVNIAPTNVSLTEKWLEKLINDIDMKILIGPFGTYCNMVGNRGLTIGAIIETSHVVMHSWDECFPALINIDVYSCSHLDIDIVFEALKDFDPVKISYKFLDRETDLCDTFDVSKRDNPNVASNSIGLAEV